MSKTGLNASDSSNLAEASDSITYLPELKQTNPYEIKSRKIARHKMNF